ncbi:MAG: hypothetical protein ABSH53_03765 [Holophaga sp.]
MMSRASLRVGTGIAVAIAALFLGCSGGTSQAPTLSATGQHPADWVTTHPNTFYQNPAYCTTCHGSYTDPTQAGGISKVSCFGCHHPNGPAHPANWQDGDQHGLQGAMAVAGPTSGMAYCTTCHNTDFADGPAISCYACHPGAPHPAAADWTRPTDPLINHAITNLSNAPVCYQCHAGGANSTLRPANPAPAGTAPGCTNNTMCHGELTPTSNN